MAIRRIRINNIIHDAEKWCENWKELDKCVWSGSDAHKVFQLQNRVIFLIGGELSFSYASLFCFFTYYSSMFYFCNCTFQNFKFCNFKNI